MDFFYKSNSHIIKTLDSRIFYDFETVKPFISKFKYLYNIIQ